MLDRDFECNNCGKSFEIVDFFDHYLINDKKEEEIKCPYCGSKNYTERFWQEEWEYK